MTGWQDKGIGAGRRVGVVIGRFQPFHRGHEQLINRALVESELTLVVIGSAGRASDVRNPWSELDRVAMLSSLFHTSEKPGEGRLAWVSVNDHLYDDNAWLRELKIKLNGQIRPEDRITLFGHDKDESTFYLKLFPEWDFVDPGAFEDRLDATTIRKSLYEKKEIPPGLPEGVEKYIRENWLDSEVHRRLIKEYDYIHKEIERDKKYKFPPSYITVDAVVVYPGKVLTIKRKSLPGVGLRSLPGGFLKREEFLLDAAIRVAEDKSGMRVKKEWLRNSRVFDHPRRSLAGRRVSHVYRFDVPANLSLNFGDKNKFKGEWIDIADVWLYAAEFFEDHAFIIEEMLK